MKLYRLLILTKNTKKSKNNFKAPKKSEIAILPCKQNKSAIYRTLHHIFQRLGRGDQGNRRLLAANWWLLVRTWGIHGNTDCLPNAGPEASTCGPML